MPDHHRHRPSFSEQVPLLGGLWVLVVGVVPLDYFAAAQDAITNHDFNVVPLVAVALVANLAALIWRRRLMSLAATSLWVGVAVGLFINEVPISAGLATILATRSLMFYWHQGEPG